MAKKIINKIDSETTNAMIDDMNSFLMKNTDVDATSLKDGGQIPYWIDTGSYALNWIIGNDFFKGIPGTRIVIVSGECLDESTILELQVNDELAKKIKELK